MPRKKQDPTTPAVADTPITAPTLDAALAAPAEAPAEPTTPSTPAPAADAAFDAATEVPRNLADEAAAEHYRLTYELARATEANAQLTAQLAELGAAHDAALAQLAADRTPTPLTRDEAVTLLGLSPALQNIVADFLAFDARGNLGVLRTAEGKLRRVLLDSVRS